MGKSGSDIAVIGMSCIYPGAPNLKSYWQNIVSKVDAVSDAPESWMADYFFDPESSSNDRIYCKRGGFIEEFVEFNPLEFGIMPGAVEGGSPEPFVALRLVKEALVDAGYLNRPFNKKRTGVIVGKGISFERGAVSCIQHGIVVDQTLRILQQLDREIPDEKLQRIKEELKTSLPPMNSDNCAWLVSNLVSAIISNRLDFQGPNFTVDGACASSLIALDLGIRELLNNTCDMMIVGGSNVTSSVLAFQIFCQLGAISKRGKIRPFDKDADGTLLGEGAGMMVLKRRADAERDKDRIYALIKSVGIASDGRALGILVPRLEGQLLAMKRAYDASGISPETIALIEAHGTGTKVGDATEIKSMTRMFGDRKGDLPHYAIGSVKSMISHTIPAAGMAGLIKSVLALYHKVLPPTLCDEPDPDFEFEKTPFYVNTETRPWIHGESKPRRAGVSAFGFGGVNTHAILEEYKTDDKAQKAQSLMEHWDTEVLVVQGGSRQDLINAGENLLEFISEKPDVDLKDLAYSLNCPLQNNALYRLAIIASSGMDFKKKLDYALRRLSDAQCQQIKDRSGIFFFENPLGRQGKLAFLFPGEGSQYVNMLSDLCIHFPEVRSCFDLTDRVFLANEQIPLPSQVVFPPPHLSPDTRTILEAALYRSEYAFPLVCAANYGLKKMLDRLDCSPQALVGHSTGETIAILASGIVEDQDENSQFQRSLEHHIQGLSIAQKLPPAKLISVGAVDYSVIAAIIAESEGALYITMDNCPNQVVLCGPEAAVEGAYSSLKKKGAICELLPFEYALHTPMYKPVRDQYARASQRVKIRHPQIETYSCATAKPLPKDPEQIRRITTDQWVMPVRFRETIEAMYADGVRIFVEVGPKENLTSFVDDILENKTYAAVASNSAFKSGVTQINHMVGILAAHHVPMRLYYLYTHRSPQRIEIQYQTGKYKIKSQDTEGKKEGKIKDYKLTLALPLLTLHKARSSSFSLKTSAFQLESIEKTAESGSMRPKVMREYLQTMNRFLGQQEEIIGAYLRIKKLQKAKNIKQNQAVLKNAIGRNNSAKQRLQSNNSLPSQGATSFFRESTSPMGPFGIEVFSYIPGKRLKATCKIDRNHHVYLKHHTLGRRVSLKDKTLSGLAVVPLTVSTELMAQVASILAPDKKLIAMTDVRANSWIEIEEGESCGLFMIAECVESRNRVVVDVKMFKTNVEEKIRCSLPENLVSPKTKRAGQDGKIMAMEGRMVFNNDYPTPKKADIQPSCSKNFFRIEPEEIYNKMLFHGPTFQAIASINHLDDQFAEATLMVPPDRRLFRYAKKYKLHTDPVLLDAAEQVVGCWALKQLDVGFIEFPSGFTALKIYKPLFEMHEAVKCRVHVTKVDKRYVNADIELLDSTGRLLMRFDGWEGIRLFDWTRQFQSFLLSPCEQKLSVSWFLPISQLPDARQFRVCKFSRPGSGIWQHVLSDLIFSRTERKLWSDYEEADQRNLEFICSRLVAKDAARLLLKDIHQIDYCPADIEILTNESGEDFFSDELNSELGCSLILSTAFSHDTAVAMVCEKTEMRQGIGIDIIKIAETENIVDSVSYNSYELELLKALKTSTRKEWLARFQCAKKAVAKALGHKMIRRPKNLKIQEVELEYGEIRLKIGKKLLDEFPDLPRNTFTAYTGCDNNLIFATAVV